MAAGVTISSVRVSAMFHLRRGRHFLDAALHVELVLSHAAMLAVENLLETTHDVGDRHLLGLAAGEGLRRAERLAEEPLNLAGAYHRELVVRRELVHAEDRNDVL